MRYFKKPLFIFQAAILILKTAERNMPVRRRRIPGRFASFANPGIILSRPIKNSVLREKYLNIYYRFTILQAAFYVY